MQKARRKKIRFAVGGACCLALLLGIFVFITNRESRSRASIDVFRIAYNYNPAKFNLDPSRLSWSYEFDFANNLFARLLRKDSEDQLVTDLPEKMTIRDNTIDFEFSGSKRSSQGHVIGAIDAYMSLKRLLLKSAGDHNELQIFVCPKGPLANMQENCDGLRVEGKHLLITVASSKDLKQVLNLLNREDYSVLLARQINGFSGELAEIFIRDTTGAYFISSPTGLPLVLSANVGSSKFSNLMPNKIELVAAKNQDEIEDFKNRKIDMLPIDTSYVSSAAKELLTSGQNTAYETQPFKVIEVVFSDSALRDFTENQRRYIGEKVAAVSRLIHHHYHAVSTAQLFQSLSWGSLSTQQLQKLRQFQTVRLLQQFRRKLLFRVPGADSEEFKSLLADIPDIGFVSGNAGGSDVPASAEPDGAISPQT